MERTFFMIKPDGVRRGLIGQIVMRLEAKGVKIIALKMMRISEELAKVHYQEHKEKDFYDELIEFIGSGPVVAMVLEGHEVIAQIRLLMGATDPAQALPGTLRGDYAMEMGENIVHGSDSAAAAKREIALFFNEEEFISDADFP